MFIVAMVIVTFGEMFVWPAVPTIASQLAPKGREGFYQGIVNSSRQWVGCLDHLLEEFLSDLYGMQVMLIHIDGIYDHSNYHTVYYMIGPLKKAGYEPESHYMAFRFF